tara:strand:+ start:644 stop:826 length:183 start_codon:yes stop_codon:yes gene_type:complete
MSSNEKEKEKSRKKVESLLDCMATADLNDQIEDDLQHPDKCMAELLNEEEDENGRTTEGK